MGPGDKRHLSTLPGGPGRVCRRDQQPESASRATRTRDPVLGVLRLQEHSIRQHSRQEAHGGARYRAKSTHSKSVAGRAQGHIRLPVNGRVNPAPRIRLLAKLTTSATATRPCSRAIGEPFPLRTSYKMDSGRCAPEFGAATATASLSSRCGRHMRLRAARLIRAETRLGFQ